MGNDGELDNMSDGYTSIFDFAESVSTMTAIGTFKALSTYHMIEPTEEYFVEQQHYFTSNINFKSFLKPGTWLVRPSTIHSDPTTGKTFTIAFMLHDRTSLEILCYQRFRVGFYKYNTTKGINGVCYDSIFDFAEKEIAKIAVKAMGGKFQDVSKFR